MSENYIRGETSVQAGAFGKRRVIRKRREAKLMHHPISFDAFSSPSLVKDEGLLEADAF